MSYKWLVTALIVIGVMIGVTLPVFAGRVLPPPQGTIDCEEFGGQGQPTPFLETHYLVRAQVGDIFFVRGTSNAFAAFVQLIVSDPQTMQELAAIGDTVGGEFSFEYEVTEAGLYSVYVSAGTKAAIVNIEWGCQPVEEAAEDGDSIVINPCANVFDGRVNNSPALDCAAPFAAYLTDDSLDIYGIDPLSSDGSLTLTILASLLNGPAPEENVLLASAVNPYTGQPITVYRLASGEIQINSAYADGKPYQIVFMPGVDGSLHHLAA